MAKNRFGQFIPDGNGKLTYEYFVTELIDKIKKDVDISNDKLSEIKAVLSQEKEIEVILVRVTHPSGTPLVEVMKQVTDYNEMSNPRYYRVDGTEYTPVAGDQFQYLDNTDVIADLLLNVQALTSQKNLISLDATGSGSIPAGSWSGSVYNSGDADGTFNGQTIEPGMYIEWNGPVGAINYNGTGTKLKICYTINQ